MSHNRTCPALRWSGVLSLLLLSPALAQEGPRSPVTLTVRGLSGAQLKGRPRRFLAINVVLENGGASDASGRLRAYRTKGLNDPTPEQVLFYERQVELPPGSRRQETVYYHCQEQEPQNRLAVVFLPDDSEVPRPSPSFPQVAIETCELSSGVVQANGNVDPGRIRILSLTSRSDDAAGVLRAAVIPGPRLPVSVIVERADLSTLPDHGAGYESIEAVLVSDLEPDALPPALAEPLLDWVAAGGQLVVAWAGRAEQLERSALAGALPVLRKAGQGSSQRGLRALRVLAGGRGAPSDEKVLVDQVVPAPGAEVLAEDGQGPLVVRGRHGAGWVTYVAFPLDAAPLRRWEGRSRMAGALLRLPREEVTAPQTPTDAPPLEELLLSLSEALENLDPPSVLLVAPLLLLYVGLVAPLNYKVLARRRRLVWAQGVAAALALVFGVLFYALGRIYKGSESLLTRVALVELATAPGKSRVETMSGYFSTDQGLTGGEGPPGAVVGPIAEQVSSREGRVLFSPQGTRMEALTQDTWALRRFRTLGTRELGHVLASLRLSGKTIAGGIDNRTNLTLRNPLLLTPTGLIDLGQDIPPGGQLTLPTSTPRPYETTDPAMLSFFRGLKTDGQKHYTARYGLSQGLGGFGDPYKGRDEQRLLGIFRGRLALDHLSARRWPVLLLARADGAEGVQLEGSARVVLDRSLVVCQLQAEWSPGAVSIRNLPPRVDHTPAQFRPVTDATGGPAELGASLQGTAVDWVWTLPSSLDAPLTVRGVTLRWRTDLNALNSALNTTWLQGWSWSQGAWVDLVDLAKAHSDEQGSYWSPSATWGDAADLVDPISGTLLVRLVNKGTEVSIQRMTLDLEGKR